MAITEAFTGTKNPVSTTEWSLTTNAAGVAVETSDGVFEIFLDISAISTIADLFEMRLYEKVLGSSSQGVVERWTFTEESDPNTRVYLGTLMNGWDVTLIKLAGTDRSLSWSIRKVA